MRRLCKLLVRLYSRQWRARYGEEFLQLLDDSKPSLRDALGIVTHAMTENVILFPLLAGGLLTLFGLVNVAFAPANPYTLWHSAGRAMLLIVLSVPISVVSGLLASRRQTSIGNGAVAGLLVSLAGNFLPVMLLYWISGRMEGSALPFSGATPFLESREVIHHWGRSVALLFPIGMVFSFLAGGLGVLAHRGWLVVAHRMA